MRLLVLGLAVLMSACAPDAPVSAAAPKVAQAPDLQLAERASAINADLAARASTMPMHQALYEFCGVNTGPFQRGFKAELDAKGISGEDRETLLQFYAQQVKTHLVHQI